MKNDFGSAFLRAEDLIQHGVWADRVLTIKEGHPPNTIKIRDGKEWLDKEALSFMETDQYLVMGKLNWRLLRYATGIESKDQAVGQVITLYAARGDWFGERGVAALRIRIPSDGVRPNIKKNIIGTDITGQKFRVPPTSQIAPVKQKPMEIPKRSALEQINACKTGLELLALLQVWVKAAPIGNDPEKWLRVAADAWAAIDRQKWEDVDELEPFIQTISDESHLTLEEKKQGKVTQ